MNNDINIPRRFTRRSLEANQFSIEIPKINELSKNKAKRSKELEVLINEASTEFRTNINNKKNSKDIKNPKKSLENLKKKICEKTVRDKNSLNIKKSIQKNEIINQFELNDQKANTESRSDKKLRTTGKSSTLKMNIPEHLEEESYSKESSSSVNKTDSDEEFKCDESFDESEDSENCIEFDEYDHMFQQSKKKICNNNRRKTVNNLIENDEIENEHTNQELKIKNLEIVKEWTYELDEETKYFKYPKIPNLDDSVLNEFISRKTSKSYQIYSCPYCEKLFTYSLCFKTHLYTCIKSHNPEFLYLCAYGNNGLKDECNIDDAESYIVISKKIKKSCTYKSNKKQNVIEHYKEKHLKGIKINEIKSDTEQQKHLTLSNKSIMKKIKNIYLYVDVDSYLFIKNYYKDYIMKKYKDLIITDKFTIGKNKYIFYTLKLSEENFIDKGLEFKLSSNQSIKLNAFEYYSTVNYELLNLCNQILSLDWCYTNFLLNDNNQYLAICTAPIKNLFKYLTTENKSKLNLEINYENQNNAENLIYIYKMQSKNRIKNQEINNDNKVSFLNNENLFAILNPNLGNCYCLKWRPDCGIIKNNRTNLIGYLLATSTNGYGYIYLIENLFKNENIENKLINIYEPTHEICLKTNQNYYGQCTSGDWCQLNGATKIALGYENGSILLFDIDNEFYYKYINENIKEIVQILPYKCINAHTTFIKTLKWSKINEYILASGSAFSREMKVWNLMNFDQSVVDYEIFITELAFSIHSTDIFMTREVNLKGDNRLYAFDIFYDAFQFDREQSRSHSSIFHTYSTLTSLDISDLLNKCIICDNNGLVMLNRAHDTKSWIHKNKSFLNSFAQIAKFNIEKKQKHEHQETEEDNILKEYNISIDYLKKYNIIKLDLRRITIKDNIKSDRNFNTFNVDLNHLTKIRWNQNLNYEHIYAIGSVSGFVFIHHIDDLKYENNID